MFDADKQAFVAISGATPVYLVPGMANRHGLITGATGTGKTVTLQNLAETFSHMGVPVFAADVKGDLSGVAAKGGNKRSVAERVEAYGLAAKGFAFQAFPVRFWDVFGETGAPLRARIGDMGPLLLARLLGLNETQTAVLTVVFKIASDEKLPLIDLKDLQKLLEYASKNANRPATGYGNMSAASIGAIQRGLTALEHGGADLFFGEPSLDIADLLQPENGKGVINILAADKLMNSPKIYTTFLLWLMTRLFDALPEVGDPEKPKLVFFFDEAHLFFTDAPKALLEKMEQVVRLIRSRGVGVYFISQAPSDIPDSVLGQLGNRVQHALRAYTPKDRKSLKAAAESFRPNPAFATETAIAELGTGEALVSFLDAKGAPFPVERAFILPPEGQIGPLDPAVRENMVKSSQAYRRYAEVKDRESAYEILDERLQQAKDAEQETARRKEEEKARREEEKLRAAREKAEAREVKEKTRFWQGVAKSILVPLVRRSLDSFLRKK